MSIVSDQFDPSGMFSKAGRVSLEMFQIIQQKDEILFNQKKYFKPKINSIGLYDLDSLKQQPNPLDELKEKISSTNQNQLKKTVSKTPLNKTKVTLKKEPFAKIVSREQLSEIYTKEKLNDKRFGMYHPRYNLVFRKSPLYIYEIKEESTNTKKKEKEDRHFNSKKNLSLDPRISKSPNLMTSLNMNTLPDLPVKLQKKVPIPTPLCKQLSRKEIFVSELNEKRFEFLELPPISTKVKRQANINLEYGGRTSYNNCFANKKSGLEYKPKYGLVFPKDDLMIPNFKKTVSRKPNEHVTYTLNETSMTYDEYNNEDFSPTGKKISGPIFEKMLSRDMSTNDSKLSLKEGSKSRSEKELTKTSYITGNKNHTETKLPNNLYSHRS